jgi:hypothetical protein
MHLEVDIAPYRKLSHPSYLDRIKKLQLVRTIYSRFFMRSPEIFDLA